MISLIQGVTKLPGFVRSVRNWPKTLLDHLGLCSRPYVCHLRNELSFEVRGGTDDRHVVFELFVERIYPVRVPRDGIVIDIGAHIGCFTTWVAGQAARVLAFEPFPDNFQILQRNVRRNGLKNVELFQAAVGRQRGTTTMYLPDNNGFTGRYSLFPGRGTRTIEVCTTTLDDVVREHNITRICLLKIDCQGSEYEIIFGMNAETLEATDSIIVECETFDDRPSWSVADLVRHLEKSGFHCDTSGNILYAQRR